MSENNDFIKRINSQYAGDVVKQAAFENALDCIYYGFGKKYWISRGWDEELSSEDRDEVWSAAFELMAEEW